MISTRRIATVLALAAGVSGLGASAADAAGPAGAKSPGLSPIAVLDGLVNSSVPAEERARMPHVGPQLSQLNKLNDLNQLHQVTDPVAPIMGLMPGLG
ncbi:hypothetical protein AB0M57_10265 [Streptomyces sp. NPDC051597]|uniref:hypothetical protein n=1 Tax=Streptomyces sp. NPDC051597 TaxID=3155049 RepID=UPI003442E6C3